MTITDHELDDHLRRTLRAVAETVTLDDDGAALPTVAQPSRPWVRAVLAAVAAVALVAGALAVARPFGGGDGQADFSTQVPGPAGPPRLLVTAPGWELTRADEPSPERGEMTFAGPDGGLSLAWGVGLYDVWLDQFTADVAENETKVRVDGLGVAGHQAAVFRVGHDGPDYVAVWAEGDYGVKLTTQFLEPGSFGDLAASVRSVDPETWFAAMPANVVRPVDRAAVADEMLADIPLPAGVDPAGFEAAGGLVADRFHLGGRITLAAACGWVGQWADATAAGDTVAAQQAVDAMSTSFEWDVLQDMDGSSMFPQTVWDFATAIATDGTVSDGSPVADVYVEALGCDTPVG
jgi:hypothetical protein